MDTYHRALKLMSTPNHAPMIQIATLVRQAIRADRVVVVKLKTISESDPCQILWSDGPTDPEAHNISSPPISIAAYHQCETTLGGLCYIQAGFFWRDVDLDQETVQNIVWGHKRLNHQLQFIWSRDAQPYFSRKECDLCQSMIASATKLLSDRWHRFRQTPSTEAQQPSGVHTFDILSPTEITVARKLARGYTEIEIAKSMNRSPNTIHVHVRNIYRKLSVNNRQAFLDIVK